jgi:predicted transcriptional regulator of viral defense system
MAEAATRLGSARSAVRVALSRLAQKTLIASPARGFYVIVPPEYRTLGCLPADQFIPDLMARTNTPYYVGLLSAAQLYGAAHQQPLAFQVFVERPRRPIQSGRVRVEFISKRTVRSVPVQKINTLRGVMNVSTPEATAFDLVGFHERAAGFDNVVAILSELSERLDGDTLAEVAAGLPASWAQRLGFVLSRVGAASITGPLRKTLWGRVNQTVLLRPDGPRQKSLRDDEWKVYVNAAVEPER